MDNRTRKTLCLTVVISMLLAGCTAESSVDNDNSEEEILETPDNLDESNGGLSPEEIIDIPDIDGCDNTNPIHCMLPFPSDAFLVDDQTTVTGKRIHYSSKTIPGYRCTDRSSNHGEHWSCRETFANGRGWGTDGVQQ